MILKLKNNLNGRAGKIAVGKVTRDFRRILEYGIKEFRPGFELIGMAYRRGFMMSALSRL
jgi:hypothetical protein